MLLCLLAFSSTTLQAEKSVKPPIPLSWSWIETIYDNQILAIMTSNHYYTDSILGTCFKILKPTKLERGIDTTKC